MTVQRRIVLATASIVASTVALASVVCDLAMRAELRGQVDDALTAQADIIDRRPVVEPERRLVLRGPPPRVGTPADYATLVAPDGTALGRRGDLVLPVTAGDRRLAADGGAGAPALQDRHVAGVHVRVLTVPLTGGGALVLGRSLQGTDRVLSRLRLVLLALCIAGTGLAALAGRRTGARFTAILGRLSDAQAAQRQLVADASHELRTPVTSLRTNAEVLLEGEDLDPAQRRALLTDVVDQAEELSALVSDLIELASGDQPAEAPQDVRLDALVAEAVERARRHAPQVDHVCDLEPVAVDAVPDRLGRAVNNLLDNAGTYSPPGGTVEVTLRGGELRVRDHGPGVPAEELPHLFDRFFRASNAREHAGSGLGLAIVRQVAERHGGTVEAVAAPGGGLEMRLSLPGARTPARMPV